MVDGRQYHSPEVAELPMNPSPYPSFSTVLVSSASLAGLTRIIILGEWGLGSGTRVDTLVIDVRMADRHDPPGARSIVDTEPGASTNDYLHIGL